MGGDVLQNLNLGIDAVGPVFHRTPGKAQRGNDFLGLLKDLQVSGPPAEVHEVNDRFPHNIVKGEHDRHRQETPKAPAHGVDTLFRVELLDFLVHLHLVIGVLFLNLLDFPVHTVHPNHTLLGLHLEGQQDQLDDQGKENQRHAVRTGKVIKKPQQRRERDTNDVSNG